MQDHISDLKSALAELQDHERCLIAQRIDYLEKPGKNILPPVPSVSELFNRVKTLPAQQISEIMNWIGQFDEPYPLL